MVQKPYKVQETSNGTYPFSNLFQTTLKKPNNSTIKLIKAPPSLHRKKSFVFSFNNISNQLRKSIYSFLNVILISLKFLHPISSPNILLTLMEVRKW